MRQLGLAAVILFALVLALAEPPPDPSEPPPPLENPAATATPATPPTPATRVVTSSVAACKSLVLAGKLEDAEACYRLNDDNAAADVVAAWRTAPKEPVVHSDRAKVSLQELVDTGRAEGMVNGAVAGAGAGFALAATVFSTTRQSKNDTLPWLIASVPIGAVAGAGGAYFLMDYTKPTTGDIALSTSTMWVGAIEGMELQLAVFDQNQDVSSIPLRYATVLGGGLAGLGVGMALSPLLDVTQGDAAVANSALVWGGVFTGFALATYASTAPATGLTTPQVTLSLLAGSLVPYTVALACHPFLRIERWPSWLIELGGAAGFLTSSALVVAYSVTGQISTATGPIVFIGLGTAAGVAVGGAGAFFVSEAVRPPDGAPTVTLVPAAMLDDNGRTVPALVLTGTL